jgi:hypothetical protein
MSEERRAAIEAALRELQLVQESATALVCDLPYFSEMIERAVAEWERQTDDRRVLSTSEWRAQLEDLEHRPDG